MCMTIRMRGNGTLMSTLICSGERVLNRMAPDGAHAPLLAHDVGKFVRTHEAVSVLLPNGRSILLQRAVAGMGGTSWLYLHPEYTLKLAKSSSDGTELAQFEACVLRAMASTALVPTLVCAAGPGLLTTHVGDPVSASNLPANYREQVASLLSALHTRGIRHNDMWKDDALQQATLFATELMVDKGGTLRVRGWPSSALDPPTCCDFLLCLLPCAPNTHVTHTRWRIDTSVPAGHRLQHGDLRQRHEQSVSNRPGTAGEA